MKRVRTTNTIDTSIGYRRDIHKFRKHTWRRLSRSVLKLYDSLPCWSISVLSASTINNPSSRTNYYCLPVTTTITYTTHCLRYGRIHTSSLLCRNYLYKHPNLSRASSSYRCTWKAANTVLHNHEWLFTSPIYWVKTRCSTIDTDHNWGLFPAVIKGVRYLNSSNFLISISGYVFSFVVCPINLHIRLTELTGRLLSLASGRRKGATEKPHLPLPPPTHKNSIRECVSNKTIEDAYILHLYLSKTYIKKKGSSYRLHASWAKLSRLSNLKMLCFEGLGRLHSCTCCQEATPPPLSRLQHLR